MIRGLIAFMLVVTANISAGDSLAPKVEKIWSQRTARWLSLEEFGTEISLGDTLVIGEIHGTNQDSSRLHHANQVRLIRALGPGTTVGMEFFEYPLQPTVEAYLHHQINEVDFLAQISWGRSPFDQYKEQIWAPTSWGSQTLALNIPRAIAKKVSLQGPTSLAPEDLDKLPPLWERGSETYWERFRETMKDHFLNSEIENYFWTQSLWDDTMAWRASLFRAQSMDRLVIIVGEFHVQFGDGLPARLKAHGLQNIKTLLQVKLNQWNEDELAQAIAPDPEYGQSADYIWAYQESTPQP